jgi:hypothetical protein
MKIDDLSNSINQIKIEVEGLSDADLLSRWIGFSPSSPRDRVTSGDRDVLERGILENTLIRRFGINFEEVIKRGKKKRVRPTGPGSRSRA